MKPIMKLAPLRAFVHFVRFAPLAILWTNVLTLIQAGIASVGILLLIPLAQLAGLDLQNYTSQHDGIVNLVVARINGQQWTHNLASVLIVYAVIMTGIAFLSYHRTLLQARIQQAYVKSMRSELYQAILESSWPFLASRRTSEYLHRVGAQVQTMNVSANQTINGMHQIVSMLIYIGLMLIVHWQFTLATILVGLLLAIILIPIRYSVRDAGARSLRGYQEIFAILSDHLSNLKMIKASAREAQFCEAVESVSEDLEQQQLRIQRAGALISLANAIGLAIGFSALLYLGVSYYDVAVAEFLILLMVMSRILPKLAGLQQTAQGIVYSLPSFLDIESILQSALLAKELDLDRPVGVLPLEHSIELKEVDYHHPQRAATSRTDQKALHNPQFIFKNFNLKINAKEVVALSGASGSGKTTIADLIASLASPVAGELLIDGVALNSETRTNWRRGLAYVTQEVYLFNDTLRNNLIWSAPHVTDQQIWSALEMASIKELIEATPNQLETYVGDKGIRFSGGERQRIAIARALLTNPVLLILDEATSAMDKVNENKIQEVVESLRGKITVLIIAHRQSTLAVADRIVEMNGLK